MHASQSAPLAFAITAGSQEVRSSGTWAGQFAGGPPPQARPATRWGLRAAKRASPGREQGHDGTSRNPFRVVQDPPSEPRCT